MRKFAKALSLAWPKRPDFFHFTPKPYRRPTMPMKIIASTCTGCSACEPECPNVAIREKGGTFIIDPKKCTDCEGHYDEPQCVAVCPVDGCIVKI